MMMTQECMKPLATKSMPATGMITGTGLRLFMQRVRELHERERSRLRYEVLRIPGLMALLMKPRNGEPWSAADRAQLRAQLRGLGEISLYAATLAIPGTTLTLPLLAWWLDRRRFRRAVIKLTQI